MITAVLDTNVLISGAFWLGPPKEVIHQAKLGFFQAVTSPALLAELRDVLTRRDKPFRLSASEVGHVTICRDSTDNRVLECALEVKADFVVTGDLDLLEVGQRQGVKVVTVRAFLDFLKER